MIKFVLCWLILLAYFLSLDFMLVLGFAHLWGGYLAWVSVPLWPSVDVIAQSGCLQVYSVSKVMWSRGKSIHCSPGLSSATSWPSFGSIQLISSWNFQQPAARFSYNWPEKGFCSFKETELLAPLWSGTLLSAFGIRATHTATMYSLEFVPCSVS